MAGRGRGRGKPMMSMGDQLGFKSEILPPTLQPPPTYPPLLYRPLPMNFTNDTVYMLRCKKVFKEHMQDSTNNVQPIVVKKDIERYCDRLQDMLSAEQTYESKYDWTRMPAELRPEKKKRKGDKIKAAAKKKLKEVDIETKLKELEKKEVTQPSDPEEEEKDEEEKEKDEEKDPDDAGEGGEEEVDEEMDEGTDYVNNYFDNGENYEDDEENLDDGAIF